MPPEPPRRRLAFAILALIFASHWHVHLGFLSGMNVAEVLPAPRPREVEMPPVTPARRVVVVLVDGLGWEQARAIPQIASLAAEGASRPLMASFPSFTFASMTCLSTGRPPLWSGLRLNRTWPWIPWDSVSLEAAGTGIPVSLALPESFDELPFLLHLPPDATLLPRADDALVARDGRRLDWVYFGDVDGAAHLTGVGSRRYLAAAARAGAIVGKARSVLDLARDALVVVSDHGHVPRGGHGGVEPEALTATFVAAGPGIRAGITLPPGAMRDVAPTLSALLGVPPPRDAIGAPMADLFGAAPADGAAIARADEEAVQQATDAAARRRLFLALFPIAAAIAATLLWGRRRGIVPSLRDAIPSLFFFALFAIGHRLAGIHVSWSIGRSQPVYQVETASLSFLAAAGFAWTARRERAAEESLLMVVFYGTLYAGWTAMLGFTFRALPSPFVSFGFLMAVTALFYAGLFTAGRLLWLDGWATRGRAAALAAALLVLFAAPFVLEAWLPRGTGVLGTFLPR